MSRFDNIGKALILLREKANLNQKDLAGRSGVTPGMLSNYENGVTMPSMDSLGKILDALDVDLVRLEVALDVVNDRPLRRAFEVASREGEPVLAGGDLMRFLDAEEELPPAVRPAVIEMIRGFRSVARQVYVALLATGRGRASS